MAENPFSALNRMAEEVHAVSKSKGFKDREVTVPEQCSNLHGEVSELWEAHRAGRLREPCDKADDMKAAGLPVLTCLEEELADVVIRALDTSRDHDVDIAFAVAVKNAYNKTRPHRNGGKIA